jgi:hypothetical protein
MIRKMELKKRKYLIFLFFLVINLIPQIFVIISKPDNLMNWFLTDDAFYYFKTAQNIAEGNGITFDGVNPTNGFHPLWMIICVPIFALAKFNLFLPLRVVAIVQIVLNAASGYFLFELISEKISNKIAWIPAMFWMFYAPIHGITTKLGLETGLTAFLLIYFFYRVSKLSLDTDQKLFNQQLFILGLCGAGVLFSRLDNIFILLMVGVWLVFRGKKISRISQIDFLLILFSAIGSFFIRLSSTKDIFKFVDFLYLLMGSSLIIKPTLLYIFHAYETDKPQSGLISLKNFSLASIISSALVFSVLYILQNVLHILDGFPRSAVFIDWLISFILIGTHHFYQYKKRFKTEMQKEDISFKTNWQIWISRAGAYFSPIVVLLVVYLVINLMYAGTAMPVSGQIKRWWGTLPHSIYGQPERTLGGVITSMFDPSRVKGPFWIISRPIDLIIKNLQKIIGFQAAPNSLMHIFIIALVWGSLIFILYRVRTKHQKTIQDSFDHLAILPLLVGTIFQALTYKSTGYLHYREWYWVGEMLLIVLIFTIFFSTIMKNLEKTISYKNMYSMICVVICGALWGNFSLSIIRQFPLDGDVPLEYAIEQSTMFIADQTDPGDVIGMTGGGLTAYFNPDRRVINLDGLINSAEYYSQLKAGYITEFLVDNNVKYIFGSELALLDSDPYRWFFTDALKHKADGSYFQLYYYQPIGK